MTLLHVTSTPSQYGLISIRDIDADDAPEMDTRREGFAFLPEHALLLARFDRDGDVSAEVHVADEGGDPFDITVIYDGVMNFPSGVMCITDAVDEDDNPLTLPRVGEWRVKIGVVGEPRPHTIKLFLDAKEWSEAIGGDI